MPEPEERFKVTDRRGRREEPERASISGSAEDRARPHGPGPASPPETPPPPERGGRPADLTGVFLMFASSALMALGEEADPSTGTRRVDLDHAREVIDVLLLLRDKTDGNRTPEESRLLEGVLYRLQISYVKVARGPADRRP